MLRKVLSFLIDVWRCTRLLVLVTTAIIKLMPAFLQRVTFGYTEEWRSQLEHAFARFCESGGPATIKLAQILSARGDLLPVGLIDSLARVRDNGNVPSVRLIRHCLSRNYGDLRNLPFILDSYEPIGVGSVAFVLRGKTNTGLQIAIKVVRPRIGSLIESDLRLIRRALGYVERKKLLPAFPLASIIEMVAPTITGQCNMVIEGCNASRLAYAVRDDVIIARPIANCSRPGSLAMEYIKPIYQFTDRPPSIYYKHACKMLLRALYRMIFIEGFVHCDLHPGNVAISGEGRPILYDYGMVAILGQRDREILRSLFVSIATSNYSRASAEILRSAINIPPGFNEGAFTDEVKLIVRRWAGRPAGDFLVVVFVRELFNLQYKYGVRSIPGFASAIWALVGYEGLVRANYPELDFQGELLLFLLATGS